MAGVMKRCLHVARRGRLIALVFLLAFTLATWVSPVPIASGLALTESRSPAIPTPTTAGDTTSVGTYCAVTQSTVTTTPNDAAAFSAQIRAAHPDAAWPHWLADNQRAWGVVGLNGGGVEGLVATDGTYSPTGNRLGISFWLR